MGWWNWFTQQRKRGMGAGRPGRVGSIERKDQHTLAPEQMADLNAAWAELAEAVKESPVTGSHACSPGRKPWQEDPAAVRTVAATIRWADAADDVMAGPAAK